MIFNTPRDVVILQLRLNSIILGKMFNDVVFVWLDLLLQLYKTTITMI